MSLEFPKGKSDVVLSSKKGGLKTTKLGNLYQKTESKQPTFLLFFFPYNFKKWQIDVRTRFLGRTPLLKNYAKELSFVMGLFFKSCALNLIVYPDCNQARKSEGLKPNFFLKAAEK